MSHSVNFPLVYLVVTLFLQCDISRAQRYIKTTPTQDTKATYIGQADTNSLYSEEFITASFLGIPYAKPPVRFEMPELDTPKEEEFHALSFGAICYQSRQWDFQCWGRESENCLFLNIYVPLPYLSRDDLEKTYTNKPENSTSSFSTETNVTSAAAVTQSSLETERTEKVNVTLTSSQAPQTKPQSDPLELPSNGSRFAVFIFIHGGAFVQGGSNCFNGTFLAGLGNIIVVTINYRLGPFGFLSTDDDVIPGNLGLWDQHVAIKWVKKHISAFGGDPDRITVGGQSAGSYSSIFQALYQGNDGLFQRVIAQSGTPVAFKSVNLMGYSTTLRVARSLNCSVAGTKQDIKTCLMNQTAEDLANVSQPVLVPGSLALQPSLDNDFVRADPYDVLSQMATSVKVNKSAVPSHFIKKDLMIGSDAQDGDVVFLIWVLLIAGDGSTLVNELMKHVRQDRFKDIIYNYFQKQNGETVDEIKIESVIDRYTDWETPDNDSSLGIRLIDLLTDVIFALPVLDTASAHAQIRGNTTTNGVQNGTLFQGSTFVYRFNLPKPETSYFVPWLQGTGHGAELGHVFGSAGFADEDDKKLSRAAITYWSNFVKTGDPNRDTHADARKDSETPTQASSPRPPLWPEYDNQDEQYLEISPNPVAKKRMRASYRNFWSSYIPRLELHLRDVYNAGVKSVPVGECPKAQANGQDTSKIRIHFFMIFLSVLPVFVAVIA